MPGCFKRKQKKRKNGHSNTMVSISSESIQNGMEVIESLLKLNGLSSYHKNGLDDLKDILNTVASATAATAAADVESAAPKKGKEEGGENMTMTAKSNNELEVEAVDQDDAMENNLHEDEKDDEFDVDGSTHRRKMDTSTSTSSNEVPSSIRSSKRDEEYKRLKASTVSATNDTNDYLLNEFHGIRNSGAEPKKESKWNVLRKAVHANSLVRKLQKLSQQSKAEAAAAAAANDEATTLASYIPKEWYDLDEESQKKLAELLSWDNLKRWDFDVFGLAELCNGQPLLFVGWAILASPQSQRCLRTICSPSSETEDEADVQEACVDGYNFLDTYDISPQTLTDFLRAIEGKYHIDNPYHNNIHAADVLQTTHIFMVNGMNYSTSTLITTPKNPKMKTLQCFSLLVSAAIHDVDHPGMNNTYQSNTLSTLALTYNDKSVLENYHVSTAFQMIVGPKAVNPNWNIFKNMEQADFVQSKKWIVEAVLGTDLSTHFAQFASMKKLPTINGEDGAESEKEAETKQEAKQAEDEYSWTLMTFIMHMADISNLAKPQNISVQWTDRILDEFFRQGDIEREKGLPISPLCDRTTTSRPDSQIGFINYIIRPSFQLLATKTPGAIFKDEVIPLVESNYSFWEDDLKRTKEEAEAKAAEEAEAEAEAEGDEQEGEDTSNQNMETSPSKELNPEDGPSGSAEGAGQAQNKKARKMATTAA